MSPVNKVSHVETRDTWTPLRSGEESSARSLLLTVLGEFVLPDGGVAWTGTLLEALGRLGVEAASARQALARTSARHLIRSERIGRRTRWSLTPPTVRILTEGAERIYGFGTVSPDWDGRWLLVLTTVPEHNRHLRSQLRTRMTWSGFGSLAPGTWVSPWTHSEHEAETILSELGLTAGSLSWIGEPGVLGVVHDRVEEIWDLDTIADEYHAFLEATARDQPDRPEDAFTALLRLVHRWRHFPGRDPGLPARLLPSNWPATEAAEVFRVCRSEWSDSAWTYYRAIVGE
jgi:phenylacetic acid degradation operon negative regulatory protein